MPDQDRKSTEANDPCVQIHARVPNSLRAYTKLAALELGKTQEEIVTQALKMHREYLIRIGVVKESA